jgi:D-alanyl-lipoteichoic acid acyltransferase DltB (MBOAT superfamily)
MVGLIVLNWAAARWYARVQDGRIVTMAIIATLGVLAIYKYADFLINSFSALTGVPPRHLGLGLPVGISFFTFHHIMYLIDLRRGPARRRWIGMLFTSASTLRPPPDRSPAGPRLGRSLARVHSETDGSGVGP